MARTNVEWTVEHIVTERRSITVDPEHFLELMNIPLSEATTLGREIEIYLLRSGLSPSTRTVREEEHFGRTKMRHIE